jgi:hypothetical protein
MLDNARVARRKGFYVKRMQPFQFLPVNYFVHINCVFKTISELLCHEQEHLVYLQGLVSLRLAVPMSMA